MLILKNQVTDNILFINLRQIAGKEETEMTEQDFRDKMDTGNITETHLEKKHKLKRRKIWIT